MYLKKTEIAVVVLMMLIVIASLTCSNENTNKETTPKILQVIVKKDTYNSIGVYGGSISSYPESDSAKLFWQHTLNIPVITHGSPGAGFNVNSYLPIIPEQIDSSPMHDIAILWCSTNDYAAPVENDDEYSPFTQNGGMRIAIEKLRAKNPSVIILGFCSLPHFPNNTETSPGAPQVAGQIKVFEEYGIPYLNQRNFFTVKDTAIMYNPDNLHFTVNGYIHIRERQLEFIKQYIIR